MDGDATLPLMGVMYNRFYIGVNSLAELANQHINDDEVAKKGVIRAMARVHLDSVMNTQYSDDAHFVCYRPVGVGADSWPRCNKIFLPHVRRVSGDIVMTTFAVDYDNPGHGKWTPELLDDFWIMLEGTADDEFPYPVNWTYLYFTRHGARLVWALEDPIPVDEAEHRHRWLCQELRDRGMGGIDPDGNPWGVDLSCSDWTRSFRCPRVNRDGIRTEDEEFFGMEEYKDNRMNAYDLGRAGIRKNSEYAEIEPYDNPQPQPSEVREFLEVLNPKTGRNNLTEFSKQAKQRLKGRECWPCLFEDEPLADKGGRNTTLTAYVGQVTGLLAHLEEATPEGIYALFYDTVSMLDPDNDTSNWHSVLWSLCRRTWEKETAKLRAKDAKALADEATAEELVECIRIGMLEWDESDELRDNDKDEIAYPYVMQRLILCTDANTFYLMRPDGKYHAVPATKGQLIPSIIRIGMDKLIDISYFTNEGKKIYATATELGNEYGQPIKAITTRPQIDGGYIENTRAQRPVLINCNYRRNPVLTPLYNKDIAEWLKRLPEDPDDHPRLLEWLANSLAFEEGLICALSLVGPAGCGKKLLFRGLVECLEDQDWGTADDLIGQWQYGLAHSPFLLINEGWPKPGNGKHPADSFREAITGDNIRVSQKYAAPMQSYNPIRAILTANNLDVVSMLASGKDLAPEDREALSVRLMHIKLSRRGTAFLQERGGMSFTGSDGRRWITGDDGTQTNYLLARHILWLHHTRPVRLNKGRMLVEGNSPEELMFEFRMGSGRAPLVVETIINMFEKSFNKGIAVHEGQLYVLAAAIREYWLDNLKGGSSEQLTNNVVSRILSNFVIEPTLKAIELPGREKDRRVRWHKIDCRLMLSAARTSGFSCGFKKMEALVEEQKRRAEGTWSEVAKPVNRMFGPELNQN